MRPLCFLSVSLPHYRDLVLAVGPGRFDSLSSEFSLSLFDGFNSLFDFFRSPLRSPVRRFDGHQSFSEAYTGLVQGAARYGVRFVFAERLLEQILNQLSVKAYCYVVDVGGFVTLPVD